MELLAEVRLALDVLPLALRLEEGSRAFYAAVADIVGDEGWRKTFLSLVRAEEAHKAVLEEACRTMMTDETCEIRAGGGEERKVMEGAADADGSLRWARAPGRSPLEILELAMQVEANSLDLYLKIADRPEFTPVKEVLRTLVEDEKKHLQRLGALLESRL